MASDGRLTPAQCDLIEGHYELARRLARTWRRRSRLHPDDRLDAATQGLVAAARAAGPHTRDFGATANVAIRRWIDREIWGSGPVRVPLDRMAPGYERPRSASLAAAGDPAAAPGPDPAERAEREARVDEAVAALGPRQRAAFLLRVEGRSHAEIARALGLRARWPARELVRRAAGRVRAALEAGGR